MNGPLIERYRTCHTHEEVEAMQELIQQERQDEYDRAKAEKGGFRSRKVMLTTSGQRGR